jgi:fatty acid desaturase
LLAGPFFLSVLLGAVLRQRDPQRLDLGGDLLRPLHDSDVVTFSKSVLKDETRGQWYLRQLHGSSNLRGGRLLDLMTGNLSHQIEHHMYPELPANRYAALGEHVRRICAAYGQHYNTGSLPRQFAQVVWRLLRHAFPSRTTREFVEFSSNGL